jgi:hypothetical protein
VRSDQDATETVIVARALFRCASEKKGILKQRGYSTRKYEVPHDVRQRWLEYIAAVEDAQREAAPVLMRLGLSAGCSAG